MIGAACRSASCRKMPAETSTLRRERHRESWTRNDRKKKRQPREGERVVGVGGEEEAERVRKKPLKLRRTFQGNTQMKLLLHQLSKGCKDFVPNESWRQGAHMVQQSY